MINDFERRALDLAQMSNYLANVARKDRKILAMEYFAYNIRIGTTTNPIVGGGQGQGLIQIQADSDFVIQYMSAGLIGTTNVSVQVTDTGAGKTFFNEPTIVANAFGESGYPFLLPVPRVVNPSTNLKIDITNHSGTNLTAAYFSFAGTRIYYAG